MQPVTIILMAAFSMSSATSAPSSAEKTPAAAGAGDLAYEIVQNHLDLVGCDVATADTLRRRLSEATRQIVRAIDPQRKQAAQAGRDRLGGQVLSMLKKNGRFVSMTRAGDRFKLSGQQPVPLPGDESVKTKKD